MSESLFARGRSQNRQTQNQEGQSSQGNSDKGDNKGRAVQSQGLEIRNVTGVEKQVGVIKRRVRSKRLMKEM